ncbi:unnamed protein product [Paramecium octaurelia]|uniref:Uncharacterized protein n=1 Tax=Paramecium octaurelia TaxID=43137 RepID=A0A8S1V6J7_PAROT|nr:unnamed protein product [Paramecium octaurelia]
MLKCKFKQNYSRKVLKRDQRQQQASSSQHCFTSKKEMQNFQITFLFNLLYLISLSFNQLLLIFELILKKIHVQDNQTKVLDIKVILADDDNSRQCSPALDSRLLEVIRDLPQHLKQKLDSLIQKTNYQLIKQNDDCIYYGIMENYQKQGVGVQIWPKIGNLLEGKWENDQLEGYCRMNYAN